MLTLRSTALCSLYPLVTDKFPAPVCPCSLRYRAELTNNANDITLHYHNDQGRLDAKPVDFPFEVIARNIGIGTLADSQEPTAATGSPFHFAGVQVHVHPDFVSERTMAG